MAQAAVSVARSSAAATAARTSSPWNVIAPAMNPASLATPCPTTPWVEPPATSSVSTSPSRASERPAAGAQPDELGSGPTRRATTRGR
jgi:hypothetical protein